MPGRPPTGRRGGRIALITTIAKQKVLDCIRAGNYKVTACAVAGIHRDTMVGWESRGKKGEEPYATFLIELEEAESDGEAALLAEVRESKPSWQAKAWILERRFPKRWAARVRQQVTEELDAFTDRLQKRLDEVTYRRVMLASREHAAGEDDGFQSVGTSDPEPESPH